ncbi:MAG: AAA family ATPase [Actinobacteria bacterium]|nr:AAA family ATPase [Actinomycetota bacterium]
MAFMRMMGVDSVEYHRDTVLQRSDDHPGAALDYYAERGESPLVWGGAGAARLGLEGLVSVEHYEDLYGPGGAQDPITGERLANTRRPGMELVVSAHKSVAELGVIGRAGDMHAILDAEREGTMAYLDSITQAAGGRRGKTHRVTPTSGLVYAHTRHATSRAGDPLPHDHVLMANAIEMLDDRGGWKAPDTTTWREHLHAATAYGRMCAAKVAVDLGYGLVPDHGPSGRLGHWAIAGIPDEVMVLHSKRSAAIDDEMTRVGYDSYRARGHAARNSRKQKRHTPVDDLMAMWRSELESIGVTVEDLARSVDDNRPARIAADLTPERTQELVAELLAADGRLAADKVFSRRDVMVAAAPHLLGLDPAELGRVVDRVLADPASIPLVGVPGAKERAYAPACVIAAEHAIAANVEAGRHRDDAPRVTQVAAHEAMLATKDAIGVRRLTDGQQRAIEGICTSGHGTDLVLGVAGAGKTTTLTAVRIAFEDAGYTVLGTATSGQAARTLGRDAGIENSSTLASLLWRLDHHQLRLNARTIVFLDEAGMTDDPDLLRLLTAVDDAGGKVVMVGDDRQLGAVGPGGSLGALIKRHEPGVWVLDENVRQHDPLERDALAELRDGSVDAAVDWMATNDRIVVAPDRTETIGAVIDGWITDIDNGLDSAMFAWRRANVDALNRMGREAWDDRGNLTGPELQAPGGGGYRAGDRIVTLAPGAFGEIVTSERGTATSVDVGDGSMRVRMADGRLQHFTQEATGADRMAHGYAITVHRSQGATFDTAHRLEDGGGRELAYVSMSRARERSTVYVVADDVDQAADDLKRDWLVERRQRWAIDSGTPSTDPTSVERDPEAPPSMRAALYQARLQAERQAVAGAAPPDVADGQLDRVRSDINRTRRLVVNIPNGTAGWEGTDLGDLASEINDMEQRRQEQVWRSNKPSASRRDVRDARRTIKTLDVELQQLGDRFEAMATPHREELSSVISSLETKEIDLKNRTHERTAWLRAHPEVTRRIVHLDRELERVNNYLTTERDQLDGITPAPLDPDVARTREMLRNLPSPHPTRDMWADRLTPQVEPPAVDRGLDIGF